MPGWLFTKVGHTAVEYWELVAAGVALAMLLLAALACGHRVWRCSAPSTCSGGAAPCCCCGGGDDEDEAATSSMNERLFDSLGPEPEGQARDGSRWPASGPAEEQQYNSAAGQAWGPTTPYLTLVKNAPSRQLLATWTNSHFCSGILRPTLLQGAQRRLALATCLLPGRDNALVDDVIAAVGQLVLGVESDEERAVRAITARLRAQPTTRAL
jgi:hypothetical protein